MKLNQQTNKGRDLAGRDLERSKSSAPSNISAEIVNHQKRQRKWSQQTGRYLERSNWVDRKHLNLDEREEHNSARNISTEENTQHSRQIKRNKLKGLNATNRTNNEVDEIWRERMERTESNSPEIPSASPLNGERACRCSTARANAEGGKRGGWNG